MSRLVAVLTWPVAGAGNFAILCLHLRPHVQQKLFGGSRFWSSVLVAETAPVGVVVPANSIGGVTSV